MPRGLIWENGNTLWYESIGKEMNKYRDNFILLYQENHNPVVYNGITCHLIFDVKMDLTRKYIYVAGGHLNNPPPSMNYASVFSHDIVRLDFLIAALDDLDILGGISRTHI